MEPLSESRLTTMSRGSQPSHLGNHLVARFRVSGFRFGVWGWGGTCGGAAAEAGTRGTNDRDRHPATRAGFQKNYFTEMCSGSEAGS